MSNKESFLRMLQTVLCSIAGIRKHQNMRCIASDTLNAMHTAQKIEEDCIPEDIRTAVIQFLGYVDEEFRGDEKRVRPDWLKFEGE